MLYHAAACGLLAAGCEVVDVGILPTPTIQIYVGATRARGGIALTASHNPPEYNALKLFNSEGLFFNSYERGELLDLYHQSDFRRAANDEIRRAIADYASAPRMHIERVLRHVDAERIRRRRFRVALDAVNGAGSVMTPGFLRDTAGLRPPRHLDRPHQAVPAHRRAAPGYARRFDGVGPLLGRARSDSPRIRMATAWPSPTRPATCWITTTCWRWPWMPRCAACRATWW